MKHFYITALLACASALSSPAAEINFSYADSSLPLTTWGTGKAETYDIAVFLDKESFGDAKVSSIKVPFTSIGSTDLSVWATGKLTLVDKVNVPDVASVKASLADGYLCGTFPAPIEIPAEGIYVGYSFTITDACTNHDEPVFVTESETPNGFWIHASRTYRAWVSKSITFGVTSALEVTFDGDFVPNSASASLESTYAGLNEKAEFTFRVTNAGYDAISSVDYTITLPELSTSASGTWTFPTPISATLGSSATGKATIDAPSAIGTYDAQITIDKVNGVDNANSGRTAASVLNVIDFVPVTRPLMEEYTGLWCGNCPRGYIALEEMNRLYPERFVALAYHNSDVMVVLPSTPGSVAGYPGAILNRTYKVDPYFGSDFNKDFYIQTDWLELCGELAKAAIDVDLEWADDTHTRLTATSRVKFIEASEGAGYKIGYILAADGVHGPSDPDDPAYNSWRQSNYYSGEKSLTGMGWEVFVDGSKEVAGLDFNDVAVAASAYRGEDGSVPASIKASVEYSHSYQFEVAEIINNKKTDIRPNISKFHVVAAVFDGDGKFVNCAKSAEIDAPAAIREVTADSTAEVVSTYATDLQGRRVAQGYHGLVIRTEILSDGTRRHTKTIM